MNLKVLEHWQGLLSAFNIDAIFANVPLRKRAEALWQSDACTPLRVNTHSVGAWVQGRTGVYWVELEYRAEGIHYSCTCPSEYQPCKHVGALLYSLKEPLAKPEDGDDEPARLRQAEKRSSDEQPAVKPIEEERFFAPGEVLEVRRVGTGAKPRRGVSGPQGHGREKERSGTISPEARFRPAFRMVRGYDHYRPSQRVLEIEPVLVYLRKDGQDGRVEKYNPRKARREGSAETEQLVRRISRMESRRCSALELVKFWHGQGPGRGEQGLCIPVDLFLERAGRLEREQRAVPRRIRRISVSWTAEEYRRNSIRYRPEITLTAEDGCCEVFDRRASTCQNDGELLLVSVPPAGSLWYLSQMDVADAYPGQMDAIGSIFALRRRFSAEEVENFAASCRTRIPGLVEVETVPRNVRIISIVPVPVIDCTIRQQIFSDDEYTVLDLRFRYGSRERRAAEDGELLPISAEEARTLAASEASGEPDEPVGSWFIAPSDELEQVLLRRLHTLLQESGCPPQPFTRGLAEYQSDEPARFLIGTDVYQLLALAGDELLQQGFELRMHGEAVSRAPGRSAVRITESGEDWLKVEEGLELEEGFLPIEDVPARGLVRAGDRTYVLPPGSRTGELLSALGQRRLGRRNLPALEEIAEYVSNPEHPALEEFFSLRRRLASFSRLEETEVPDSFRGSLRPYQRSGLAWLWFLHSYELGGCLADDMGLGKTIQALALLAKAREEGQMRRALVVCPVSTLGNWHREIGQFTPCLSAHIHSGQKRSTDPEALSGWDILLVGYATVHRDVELLRQLEFDYLILDEAQAIKNPGAKRRRAIASLHAVHRLALTGTPIENSTVELWSLMDILMPGILGSRTDFSRIYGKEIEEGEGIRAECAGAVPDEPLPADEDGRSGSSALARLRRIIRPLILRRTKAAVTPELPPREELVLHAEAGPKQTRVYESLRQRFADEVEEHISRGGRGEGGMKILEAMLRLRQAAILPSLVDSEFSQIPSAKIEMLYDRLLELREEGNRALVFSQFTSVLDEVQQRMAGCGLALFRLDGSTPQQRRDEAIAAFQKASGPGVFLISLKAGGVGINLTAADYVFLLDPWWNPAVESQAIDRAHRIGRKGGVLAYRLITKGTIEEKMLRLQERKRRISESLIRGESGALRELTDEDIRELFEKE